MNQTCSVFKGGNEVYKDVPLGYTTDDRVVINTSADDPDGKRIKAGDELIIRGSHDAEFRATVDYCYRELGRLATGVILRKSK